MYLAKREQKDKDGGFWNLNSESQDEQIEITFVSQW